MTTQTLITLSVILFSLFAYYFKLHIKVVAYFAAKNQPWAVKAAKHLHLQKELKDAVRKKRKFKMFCELADMESEARGGIRIYVIETNQGGYRLFSRDGYFNFLHKRGMKGTDAILIKEAVYWTKSNAVDPMRVNGGKGK